MAQDPSEVRGAIEQDRQELAETIQALTEKADVRQRVRVTVSRNAEQLQRQANELVSNVRGVTPQQVQSGLGSAAGSIRQRPVPFAVAAAFLVGLLMGRRSGRGGGPDQC